MSDPRQDGLTDVMARVEGAACRLGRLTTRAALVGGVAGALLWWVTVGDRVGDWWQGTGGSLLVFALCVAAPAWLANVRYAQDELVELPDKLGGVSRRRGAQLRGERPVERPAGCVLAGVRSIQDLLRDYGDVMGSWGAVAQLLAPTFWLLTAVAPMVVPVLVVLAAGVALAHYV